MRANTEAVEGNKVRLSVEIDEHEVDAVLDEAIRTLARQARVPGFRPGKVPRPVLEARMGGAGVLRAEALREAIPDFYARALADTEIDPISAPEIDITAGEDAGALAFDALVQVRPLVAIPGYAGLEITVPSPVVTDADVDAQIDRLRDTEAELVEVSRAAADGDFVTVDLHGTLESGAEVVGSDDYLYQVGSGTVVPALDDHLRGAKVGDVLAFSDPSAAAPDAPGSEAAGSEGPEAHGSHEAPALSFRVLVKEVKEKKLPDVTDAWAAEASELSTVAELREDLRTRLAQMKAFQTQLSLRQGALGALAELVDTASVPDLLVEEEVRQRVHDLGHRLEEQRVGIADFLAATGRTEEEFLDALRHEARGSVKSDLALRALAEAEGIDVEEDEIDAEVQAMADRLHLAPTAVRERLTRAGRMTAVRSEQRKVKALSWLLDHVVVVDEAGAAVSRDDLKAVLSSTDEGAGADGPEEGGTSADGAPEGDRSEGAAEQVVAGPGTATSNVEAQA